MSTRLPAGERREQILDVAVQVFAKQGFHGASMNDIADAAGVTKPGGGVLTEPPRLMRGANSFTWWTGTPASRSFTRSGNSATTFTVGCRWSVSPMCRRMPLLRSSAGVWMAPAATNTVRA